VTCLVSSAMIAAPQRHRAAVAGLDADVLLAVHLPGDRHRDHAGAGLELPQLLAVLGVESLDVAVRGAGEQQAAGGGQGAGPQRELLLVLPGDLAGLRVDGAQDADVVVKQLLDAEALAQVGGAGLVGDLLGPVVHRPVVGRDVEQAGVRAVATWASSWCRPGRAARRRCCRPFPGLPWALAGGCRSRSAAGLEVEALGPGDAVDERPGADQRGRLVRVAGAGLGELFAVGDEEEAVAVGVGRGLDQLAGLRILVLEQQRPSCCRRSPRRRSACAGRSPSVRRCWHRRRPGPR
jgi:hypothetical protein